MKARVIVILVTVVFLVGCKAGKNYNGSDLTVPDKFYFEDETTTPELVDVNTKDISKDSIADLDFFSLFNDIVLDTLLQKALTYNQDLKIAAETIVQAQDGLIVQRSAMLPNIGVDAGASRGNFQGIVLPQVQNTFYATAFASWEIDFWGKFRRLNEAARARILQSEEAYRATKLSLVTSVATNYFLLLDYKNRLEISERNLALRDSVLQIIQQRYDKGIVAEIDLNQAQIKRAVAAEAVPLWKRFIAQTEHRLSLLTGANPGRIVTNTRLLDIDTAFVIPAGLPSHLLLRRPDIMAAEQNLIAQNAITGATKATMLPNVSLTGLLGAASNELSTLTDGPLAWNVGGSIFGPLFNFGRLQRQVNIEESKTNQTLLAYERTVLDAFRSVEDALVEITTLKEQLKARQERLDASLNAQYLSGERYDKGVTSYLEFLESQRQAFEAELNYTETRRELLDAYVNLYRALGGGWE
ncbi:TolC family protein [Paucihalobacter ruber]|uniref:TolC family protein n=1 Tax=Paucihalobacter ruber TaxID=2567861 RepID=A0A506PD35_9FLAO|nr:TolC family protein [Paucihalobacter ruber]TPV31428.1 TolC family protein [Paucihalobacter ruber]